MSRLLSRASSAIISSVSGEGPPDPPSRVVLTVAGETSGVSTKRASPIEAMLLVTFVDVSGSDAFGIEYREVVYQPPTSLRTARWRAKEWRRANANRAVPSTGAKDASCMYLLGSRSEDRLNPMCAYQVRVAVHRVSGDQRDYESRGRCATGWSQWSKASEPLCPSVERRDSSIDPPASVDVTEAPPSVSHRPTLSYGGVVYPALPDECTIEFSERKSLGMVLRGVKPPLDDAHMRVFVVQVEPCSVASDAGVIAGFELLALNGHPVGIAPCEDLSSVIAIIKSFCAGEQSGTNSKVDDRLIMRFKRVAKRDRPRVASRSEDVAAAGAASTRTSSPHPASIDAAPLLGRGQKAMRAIFGGLKGNSTTASSDAPKKKSRAQRVGKWLKRRMSSDSEKEKRTDASSRGDNDDIPEAMGLVPFEAWRRIEKQKPDSESKFFRAQQIMQPNASTGIPCWITVSNGTFVSLRESDAHKGWASVVSKFVLGDLVKVTSRKSAKNLVVFHIKGREGEGGASKVKQLSFIVHEKAACVALVKRRYRALRA
eukprot:g977.t1